MQDDFEIVLTADGSQTILNKVRNTTYHSINGAVTESKHVFIKAGLQHVLLTGIEQLKILEIGFGTGLNAFLTYLECRDLKLEIDYCGIENYPLPFSITDQLTYPDFLGATDAGHIYRLINAPKGITDGKFKLRVVNANIEDIELPENNKLVYFDAFGPEDQAEMWEINALSKIVDSMDPDGVLVTYCAQGQFKRNLKQLGCDVKSLPGPPGKREMVRATLRKTRGR